MDHHQDSAQGLVLLNRLNAEPIVVLGLTKSEMLFALIMSTVFWVPTMAVIMIWIGRWSMGGPIGLLAMTATVMLIGVVIGKVKRRRPVGYYQQWIMLKLENVGLFNTGLVRRIGYWDTCRQKSYATVSDDDDAV